MGCCQIKQKHQSQSSNLQQYKVEELKNLDNSQINWSVQESYNDISQNFIGNMKTIQYQANVKYLSQIESRNTSCSNTVKINIRNRFLPDNSENLKDLLIQRRLDSKQSGKIKTYETFDKANQKVMIVKSYEIESNAILNNLMSKAMNLKSEIYQISTFLDFDFYAEQDEKTGKYFLNVITDYQRKGNLRHFIQCRKKHKKYLQESIILSNLKNLIQEMSNFQKRGLFHGNIHPNNLFIEGSNQNIKIQLADFPFQLHKDIDQSFHGNYEDYYQESFQNNSIASIRSQEDDIKSLIYMSPQIQNQIVKYYYLDKQNEEGQDSLLKISFNPYKSDTYSLGLCFISLCSLQEISSLNTFLNISCKLEQTRMLGYSEKLVQTLELMLKPDEITRPDFIQLQE